MSDNNDWWLDDPALREAAVDVHNAMQKAAQGRPVVLMESYCMELYEHWNCMLLTGCEHSTEVLDNFFDRLFFSLQVADSDEPF